MTRFENTVALITGVARGQGRSHALRLAAEGADIIGVDICADIDTVPYPMATRDELDEVARLVEEQGRRFVAKVVDVRDYAALKAAVAEGVETLGRLDYIVANAGVSPMSFEKPSDENDEAQWQDVLGVNLSGVWHAVKSGVPHILAGERGGSIVLIGSTAGLRGMGGLSGGGGGYGAAKAGVAGLARGLANDLAHASIRVNVVHPTAVNTLMATNEALQGFLATQVEKGVHLRNAMPVDLLEPEDITNAVAFLLSDEARYITGVNLPVDAGFVNRIG